MKFYTRRRVSPVITIVSLVDILTMVLMFFVYTTTFKTQQEQVQIVLPKVGSSGEAVAATAPVILAVDKQGEVYLDNKLIAVDDLRRSRQKTGVGQPPATNESRHGRQLRQSHGRARRPEGCRRLERIHLDSAKKIAQGTRPLTGMVLEIVKYGDPVLMTKGKRVEQVDDAIKQLAQDMTETMYAARGLGLAAQQIGVALQLTVVDVAPVQEDRPSTMKMDGEPVDLAEWMPMVLLNPKLELKPEKDVASEGCLSFPEIHGDVPRSTTIKVHADLLDGGKIDFEASGMLARAIQHEVDHLHGILFVSRMNSAAKAGLSGRLKRLHKEGASNPSMGKPRVAKRQPVKPAAVEHED